MTPYVVFAGIVAASLLTGWAVDVWMGLAVFYLLCFVGVCTQGVVALIRRFRCRNVPRSWNAPPRDELLLRVLTSNPLPWYEEHLDELRRKLDDEAADREMGLDPADSVTFGHGIGR